MNDTQNNSDDRTTLSALRRRVEEFVSARDWHQFHSPKNLSMALAIEAAELMEHFQWLTPDQSRQVAGQADRLGPVAEELADVFCYALAMANQLGIDVATAIEEKMRKNEEKYPADEYRGLFGADDPNRETRDQRIEDRG
ncbi:MAG: nucleotide pyrophosphohydrolase [Pirellulales bacterium]|nr:nucleotide pyrophosphohydrolase [Pirellulales bacterium]